MTLYQLSAAASRGNIYFLRTRDEYDRHCHYFLQVDPAKEKQFRKAMTGAVMVDYSHYGDILASGFGHIPSSETVELLEKEYLYIFSE